MAGDDPFPEEFASLARMTGEYGWVPSPKMLGREMATVKRVCERLGVTAVPEDRRAAELELAQLLVFNALHTGDRAYSVWLAMQQPHVSKLSHVLERATQHYFWRDHMSAVLCLLSFIDGTVRSHFEQLNPNVSRPTYADLIGFVRSQRPTRSYPRRHQVYCDALADFLQRWLFPNTNRADFTLSALNRHYVAHGLGSDCYYRPEDSHRLFLFVDLYMEMLTLECGVGEYVFRPDYEPGVARRAKHYEHLQHISELFARISPGRALMKEHPHFESSDDQESIFQLVRRWASVMGLDRPRRR